jgi:phosphate transport system protein
MANKNDQHIAHQFDDELAKIEHMLLEMGALVEKQLRKVLRALAERDTSLADDVCSNDAHIDDQEVAIDDRCALLIAKRQPTARDMRAVIATMRSIFDLERIGDEVTKIARSVIAMSEEEILPKGVNLVARIGEDVAVMLRDALSAVDRKDVHAVTVIAPRDQEVDKHCNNAIIALAGSMAKNPDQIHSCINLLWVVRSLERIGDRACNLTEHVVYSAQGKDIRHVYDPADIKKFVDR